MSTEEFTDAVMAHFDGGRGEQAAEDVASYFAPGRFTGSQFEILADDEQPNRVTAADLVAVSTLGVNIPPGVAIWLLSEEGRLAVSSYLARVPANVDIWEGGELLTAGGQMQELWDLLRSSCWPASNTANGMGITKTSKLLAAKRPRLLPILDSVVRDTLPVPARYWDAFSDLLSDPDRRDIIRDVTIAAPPHVSLLRRVDVVLWMAHRPSATEMTNNGAREQPS